MDKAQVFAHGRKLRFRFPIFEAKAHPFVVTFDRPIRFLDA